MVVGRAADGKPVTAHDLKAEGAMAALLKDALATSQTLEGLPPSQQPLRQHRPWLQLRHGHPDGHMRLADYAVTEDSSAGPGREVPGYQVPSGGLTPSPVVVVATLRALMAICRRPS